MGERTPPRFIWVNEYESGLSASAFRSESEAKARIVDGCGYIATRQFVEVLHTEASV